MADDPLQDAVAERLTRAARAAQDLSEVLWEVLHDELSDRTRSGPRAQRVADLSERVADVSSTVAALARDTVRDDLTRASSSTVEPASQDESPIISESSTISRSTFVSEPPSIPEPAATPTPLSGAVIVDERVDPAPLAVTDRPPSDPREGSHTEPAQPPTAQAPTAEPTAEPQPPSARGQPTRARPLPWDEPLREEMRVTRRTVDRPAVDKPT